jgi:hypothetical protein
MISNKILCVGLLALSFSAISAVPAQAGQLFPPSNLSNPASDCPSGQVLAWNGEHGTVECSNPTPGITVSCPAGQVLTGIVNGVPTCSSWNVKVETTTYGFSINGGTTVNYLDCAAGYVAIACTSVVVPSGAFSCETTPDMIDPATGMSACDQANCGSHEPGDTGYYSTATCASIGYK